MGVVAGDAAAVQQVTLRFAARLAHRSLAFSLVSTVVEHVSADREIRNAVTTAFGEAFNNVCIHAYAGKTDGVLEVDVEVAPGQVTLHLKDWGASADLSAVAEPDLDGLPEGGLGVFMMHALVDEVVYRSGSPNVLSLTKRLPVGGGPPNPVPVGRAPNPPDSESPSR